MMKCYLDQASFLCALILTDKGEKVPDYKRNQPCVSLKETSRKKLKFHSGRLDKKIKTFPH